MSAIAGDAELLEGRRRRSAGRVGSRRSWGFILTVVVVVSFASALDGSVVNASGWRQVAEFAAAAISPETSASFLRLTLHAALTTLGYAVMGTTVSVVVGVVFGTVATRASWRRPFSTRAPGSSVARALLSLPRGLHEVVWALLLVNVLGADPLVAVLGIGIPYGAITAKVFAEILDEAPQRPLLALRAQGTPRPVALLYGLLPAAAPDMISYAFYRFECSIRSAAVLGVIGAGGLGYQLLLSFRTLEYGEMWTLVYALMVLSGLADLWSGALRRRVAQGRSRDFMRFSLVAWAALLAASIALLQIDLSALWSSRTLDELVNLLAALWPPALPQGSWAAIAEASIVTLEMSVIAIALAAAGGAAMGASFELEARGGVARLARGASKLLLLLCRAVPPPVWALLVLFVLLPGVLPGAVALAIYNFGILGRLMGEAAENAERAPTKALAAAGASSAGAWLYGTAPRLVPRFVALALYRWEVTTRETVIVGLVGAGGLGRLLDDAFAAFDFGAVAGVLAALVLVTVLVDVVSSQARLALR